jgi:hypothetical protein
MKKVKIMPILFLNFLGSQSLRFSINNDNVQFDKRWISNLNLMIFLHYEYSTQILISLLRLIKTPQLNLSAYYIGQLSVRNIRQWLAISKAIKGKLCLLKYGVVQKNIHLAIVC